MMGRRRGLLDDETPGAFDERGQQIQQPSVVGLQFEGSEAEALRLPGKCHCRERVVSNGEGLRY
jgi:hypothetical protein